MLDRQITIAAKMESGTPTPSLPADVQVGWCRRLAMLALIYSAGYFVVYAYAWAEVLLYGTPRPSLFDNVVAVLACSLGAIVHVRSKSCKPSGLSVTKLALIFQLCGALGIVAGTWGWEHDLLSQLAVHGSALALEASKLQEFIDLSSSWGLGLFEYAGVNWVGPWILLFPFVVSMTPRRTLVASLVTATVVPAVAGTSLLVNGVPEPLRVWIPGFLGRMMVPTYVCAIVAYFGARVIYRLTHDLSKARRIGNYQLLERIGVGGMGEVWKAKHRMLVRPSAIKLIRPESLSPCHGVSQRVLRFEREAQATAALSSPHTIHVYDFGTTEDGQLYYVMELLNGLDLRTLVQNHGPVPAGRAIHFLSQACSSLAEAHAGGLVHRDVKPANIFACKSGLEFDFVKVLDFGLVKEEARLRNQDERLTMEGFQAGTPDFMAPEMAAGGRDLDARADIYALGCVGYWLLTGQPVFEGDTPLAILLQHVQAKPTPPSARSELEIPTELDRIILDCLQKDPARRPASALDLASRLAVIVQNGVGWSQRQAESWWRVHQPQRADPDIHAPLTPVEMKPVR
jgi:serine/threonine-protein kinase